MNNSPKIPVSSTDIREAFYKLSDGLHGIISATASDSATSGDKELSEALDELTDGTERIICKNCAKTKAANT